MIQKELLELHTQLCESGRVLMEKKNSDYGATDDAFANFRMASLIHIDPALGAMLRMQDKMARIVSFIERGELKVQDETVRDSIIDLINYSVILAGLIGEKPK